MRPTRTVVVLPAWDDNPYLDLLSRVPASHGTRFLPALTVEEAIERSDALTSGDVFHLHWTAPVVQGAAGPVEARLLLDRFERLLTSLHSRGIAIVWTVHNLMPHELVHAREEQELLRLLASRADAIHIMAPGTAALLAPVAFLDPEKTHRIAHPHYATCYPRTDRGLAREVFGLTEEQFAVLHFGNLRPYKGLDALFGALERARAIMGRQPVLLLTGHAAPHIAREVTANLPAGVRAVTELTFTPPDELGVWVAASDVVALPYRSVLNSGSVHLAGSLHRPVILPGDPHIREQFHRYGWVRYFDPAASEVSLAEAIADSSRRAATLPDAYRSFLDDSDPLRVSRRYDQLLQRVRPHPDSPGAGADRSTAHERDGA
ncbi:hypothetical protein QNO21_02915 [Microbacterium sp. zg-Y818]|uniref:hypothetical protein n=1 Tax=unclassified Microbacterium TaxID=2609290 RepID=UPI00214B9573|nr:MULTISPECIES: hypothetical protein [unclassified Microbacterium]MCR2801728.1 hypothetical protein [Microbacterium sp. zg.Y818]WIM23005.1 hypothetical protein QNO21_02915 [Microbacterium sp. zg-Y818]